MTVFTGRREEAPAAPQQNHTLLLRQLPLFPPVGSASSYWLSLSHVWLSKEIVQKRPSSLPSGNAELGLSLGGAEGSRKFQSLAAYLILCDAVFPGLTCV